MHISLSQGKRLYLKRSLLADPLTKATGVMLLPGVGFDVVPSNCLAADLKARLPEATQLTLGLDFRQSRLSLGTAMKLVENQSRSGLVRRGGVLTPVPAAAKTRRIDCGHGPVSAMTIS